MSALRPVILSGGTGTRLWPLSTPDTPKQFVDLVGGRSLFEMTLARLTGAEPLIVTGHSHLPLVTGALENASVVPKAIIVEPVPRNTGPAAVAAALCAEPLDVLVILPSDHLVADPAGFADAVELAAEHSDEAIVTLGVAPSRPETGYGYIEVGKAIDGAHSIARFTEKPTGEVAVAMASDGKHLWNSGIFVVRADLFLEEARKHHATMVQTVESSIGSEADGLIRLSSEFESAESISIDHAVMEKTDRGRVVRIDVGWDDLGSYRSLLAASELDKAGNHIDGDVVATDVTDSYIRATSRRVVVAGLDEVVVVETPDAVLVIPLDRAQDVRDLK